MSGNADTLTFSLQKPVLPEALTTLRDAVVRAVEGGAAEIAIDVDDVGILDSQVISTLIAILRDVRSHGASMQLRARRQSILDTLRITALDKVFTVAEPSPRSIAVAPAPRARRKMPVVAQRGRLVASVAAGAFAAASLLGTHGVTASGKTSTEAAGAKTAPDRNRR